MSVDDALNRRQPNAITGEIVGAMQAFEDTEQLIGIGHVKARAVI
jgi:hypothetical protein